MLVALIVLIALIVLLGGGGFAMNVLWYILIAAVILWLIGFFVRTGEGRRWYYW